MLFLSLVLSGASYSPSDSEIEALLNNMTIQEKVGQMAQLGIDDFVPTNDDVNITFAKLALNQYLVGSVLNTYRGDSHTPQTWARIIDTLVNISDQNPKKIPLLYGLDSIHGASYVTGAVLFPQEIGIAATFNLTTAEYGSEISAYETRAANVPWVFAPVVDLGLDFRWSRLWEDFGEDPYLSGQMGAAMVRGFQGKDPYAIGPQNVAASGKHYLGYGNPISGKDRTPAVIPENYLREYHLPSFKALVDAKIATIMVNSGLINGIPVHSSKFLLTDLLKNELGFDGFVVTDWGDIENIHIRDHVANSSKEAVRLAINAGIDMAMIPYNLAFVTNLLELVAEGKVELSRINDAVRRILRVKARLGLWQNRTTHPTNYPLFAGAVHRKASYDAAAESVTLLKNTGNVLPLPTNKSILVTGPNANSIRSLLGGWSYSWQGEQAPKHTANFTTILKAINASVPGHPVKYIPGVTYNETGKYWEEIEGDIAGAAAAAKTVDYVVLVLGENSYTEKPGDLQDLSLSALQLKLAKAVLAANKPTILILNEGRPRIIDAIERNVSAILQIYLPGHYGGNVTADVLFGKINPSGKLPYTYPRTRHALLNYWHKLSEEQTAQPGAYNYESDYSPLWEFGFGLSYTNFTYSNLVLSSTKIKGSQTLAVNVTVTNNGRREGQEVVQLYTSDLYASTAPDKKRLRRFTKVNIPAGQARIVSFEINADDLSFVNTANKRVTEPGEFRLQVGPLTQNFFYE
jgi:beta-glucosidase